MPNDDLLDTLDDDDGTLILDTNDPAVAWELLHQEHASSTILEVENLESTLSNLKFQVDEGLPSVYTTKFVAIISKLEPAGRKFSQEKKYYKFISCFDQIFPDFVDSLQISNEFNISKAKELFRGKILRMKKELSQDAKEEMAVMSSRSAPSQPAPPRPVMPKGKKICCNWRSFDHFSLCPLCGKCFEQEQQNHLQANYAETKSSQGVTDEQVEKALSERLIEYLCVADTDDIQQLPIGL
mmetsp:Transcript_24762/g.32341  ORF Transcript_24762/g.32341 Transcript_24762/m.32341 type:complete len:240 (-) Transcript_24762:443-1162(-)|eukprot:CAMPEP_0117753060 /NCGR_PEP_ID=MMETSP0947-20121206/11994_1 /TAXON_ID=44440 /ORGANISM="Chattonella subsalsa, Strain CCMP2191" /LENGTH=239 /DNA_ID=CAMNT_0005571857 /DNA_START=193 /DNA_END=912 /DNA_ORIENTATION=+